MDSVLTKMESFAGRTGHAEVVRVVFYPEKINFRNLLKVFWESHDPTQGNSNSLDKLLNFAAAINIFAGWFKKYFSSQ